MAPPGLPSYPKLNPAAVSYGAFIPASPPPEKVPSSTTLFDMISHEMVESPQHIAHPSQHQLPGSMRTLANFRPPPTQCPVPQPPVALQDRIAALLTPAGSPPLVFNDASSTDLVLTILGRDGFSVSVGVHFRLLVNTSCYFARRMDRSPERPISLEISDCDDIELYLFTIKLMYIRDHKKLLLRQPIPRIIGILKIAADIRFDAAVYACLEFVEAMPWPEEEEDRIASLMRKIQHDFPTPVRTILMRVERGDAVAAMAPSAKEKVLLRLLRCVLDATDDKARREMKSLVSRLLRHNVAVDAVDVSANSLCATARGTINALIDACVAATSTTPGTGTNEAGAAPLGRLVDNVQWLAEVMIDRGIGAELLAMWAAEQRLVELRPRLLQSQRHELSRVTARLCVAVGSGLLLATLESRCLLLQRWLEPFMEDFAWLHRACAFPASTLSKAGTGGAAAAAGAGGASVWTSPSAGPLDRRSMEEGLCSIILTLPAEEQGSILMSWFQRYARDADGCPNLQRAFEVWWRRTFVKRI